MRRSRGRAHPVPRPRRHVRLRRRRAVSPKTAGRSGCPQGGPAARPRGDGREDHRPVHAPDGPRAPGAATGPSPIPTGPSGGGRAAGAGARGAARRWAYPTPPPAAVRTRRRGGPPAAPVPASPRAGLGRKRLGRRRWRASEPTRPKPVWVSRSVFRTQVEARAASRESIEIFDHPPRPHRALGCRTPLAVPQRCRPLFGCPRSRMKSPAADGVHGRGGVGGQADLTTVAGRITRPAGRRRNGWAGTSSPGVSKQRWEAQECFRKSLWGPWWHSEAPRC